MEPFFDFIQSTGGKVIGFVLAAIVVIVIISWIDRNPSQSPEVEKDHKKEEQPRDDQ